MKGFPLKLTIVGLAVSMLALPSLTLAQNYGRHHQEDEEWKAIGVASAALGVYGLIKGDDRLAFIGLSGAAYAAGHRDRDRYGRRVVVFERDRYRDWRHDNGRHEGWYKRDRDDRDRDFDRDRDRDRRDWERDREDRDRDYDRDRR